MSQKYEHFGKYILLEKLATGGMAEVWLARAPGAGGIGKFVAIKKILPQFSDNPEFLQMFKDEATIAMNLSHGNIVSIYELGQEKNQLFLVMDFVEGRNLRQILNKMKATSHKFAIDQITYMLKEVAGGLDHAHRSLNAATGKPLNIIHRDMSPQNVMISFEGEVKIVDFGIAKAESQLENTRTGTLKGKFGYMSPEQAEGQQTDLRTDIFSLGIVLWELLANDRLFIANNEINTLRKIRECNVPSLTKINPNIAPELERIVMKALTRDRNLRYQTSAAMHRDLNRFLNRQYPDFSPHDFSVFIKTLYTDEILELRGRQVEYAKIPFKPNKAGNNDDDKTMVTSFPQSPELKNKPLRTGTVPSIQSIRSTKNGNAETVITATETFTESSDNEKTVTRPAEGSGAIDFPNSNSGSKSVLNESILAESLKNSLSNNQVLNENIAIKTDSYDRRTKRASTSGSGVKKKSNSANQSLNLMIFLAGMIVTYIVISTFFPEQMNQIDKFVQNMMGSAEHASTPLPVPGPGPIVDNKIVIPPPLPLPLPPPPPPAPVVSKPTGLTINSSPSGAAIFINGTDTGRTTPSLVEVPSDKSFNVGLKLEHYLEYTKTNLTVERTGRSFTATLQKAFVAYLDIDVKPPVNAKIYVNGKLLRDNILPITSYAIPADTSVVIRAENPSTGASAEQTVNLRADQKFSVILKVGDRRPSGHRSKP